MNFFEYKSVTPSSQQVCSYYTFHHLTFCPKTDFLEYNSGQVYAFTAITGKDHCFSCQRGSKTCLPIWNLASLCFPEICPNICYMCMHMTEVNSWLVELLDYQVISYRRVREWWEGEEENNSMAGLSDCQREKWREKNGFIDSICISIVQ